MAFHIARLPRPRFATRIFSTAILSLSLLIPLSLADARADEWRHGLSLYGELKYGPDFEHFDYANPDAPKGGTLRMGVPSTFDSFNPYIRQGTSAGLVSYVYETLMKSTLDEPSTEYGLIAEAVKHPSDYSSVTFRLREEARWHDGRPITVDDVIFSLNLLKEHNASIRFYYANVVGAEETSEREVTFTFDTTGNRELPLIVGQLPILPKHWYVDENGADIRDFSRSSLEVPLGSGPYRISNFQAGRFVEVERVEDYWGRDLPVNRGWYNFDRVRHEYFRDLTPLVEAFKAGTLDFRAENSAKNWATEYDFPARRRGDVVLEEFRFETVEPFQGYVFNLRREKFQDRRVREAFNLAFDFEWLNDNIFFGQYARTRSYFQGSEMEATGLPEGLELEILEIVRDQVPEEVFTTEFTNPVGGGDRAMRNNLRQAAELLTEAGYDIQNGFRVHRESGQTLSVEFLFVDPSSERILSPYQQRLQQLGIRVNLRRIDPSQFQNRVMDHDFDVITLLYPQSLSPGNEQRSYFGTEAADSPTSRNFGGIKDPAIDAIIERLIFAEDRETLVASARALDRVLMWNRYHMPQFHSPTDRVARWDIFGLPETLPPYASTAAATLDLWWFDAEKAQRIRRN